MKFALLVINIKKTILKIQMIKNRIFPIFLSQAKASLSLKKIVQKSNWHWYLHFIYLNFHKLKLLG